MITGDFLTQEIKIDKADSSVIPWHMQAQEPLALEFRNFLDAIEDKVERPLVISEDAIHVTEIAEAEILPANIGCQYIRFRRSCIFNNNK